MKINKEFAPITITIETVEDKNQFLDILEAAYRKVLDSNYNWIPKNPLDNKHPLVSNIEYIRKRLV